MVNSKQLGPAAAFLFNEGASLSTPAAGKVVLYAKADGLMYSKDDQGVETVLSLVGGAPDLSSTLAIGNITDGANLVFSDGDNLLWATDGGGDIGSGPTSLDNRPSNIWVKDQLQIGDSTVTLTSGGDIVASGAHELNWNATTGIYRRADITAPATPPNTNTYIAHDTVLDVTIQGPIQPNLIFRRHRTSLAAPSTVLVNETIGAMIAESYIGPTSEFVRSAAIKFVAATAAPVDGTSAPTAIQFSTATLLSAIPRWRIASDGDLLVENGQVVDIGSTNSAQQPQDIHLNRALNIGNVTAVTGIGDIIAGDGTRSMSYNATTGDLSCKNGIENYDKEMFWDSSLAVLYLGAGPTSPFQQLGTLASTWGNASGVSGSNLAISPGASGGGVASGGGLFLRGGNGSLGQPAKITIPGGGTTAVGGDLDIIGGQGSSGGIGGNVNIDGGPGGFAGGGNVNITGGAPTSGEAAGGVWIEGGSAIAATGGAVTILGGTTTAGNGGSVNIDARAGVGASGDGGSVLVRSGGAGGTTRDAGDITLQTLNGGASSGDGGSIFLQCGTGFADGIITLRTGGSDRWSIDASGDLVATTSGTIRAGSGTLTLGSSGVTTDFLSGSTVDFTGATVTGLPGSEPFQADGTVIHLNDGVVGDKEVRFSVTQLIATDLITEHFKRNSNEQHSFVNVPPSTATPNQRFMTQVHTPGVSGDGTFGAHADYAATGPGGDAPFQFERHHDSWAGDTKRTVADFVARDPSAFGLTPGYGGRIGFGLDLASNLLYRSQWQVGCAAQTNNGNNSWFQISGPDTSSTAARNNWLEMFFLGAQKTTVLSAQGARPSTLRLIHTNNAAANVSGIITGSETVPDGSMTFFVENCRLMARCAPDNNLVGIGNTVLASDTTLAQTTGGAEQTLTSHTFPAASLIAGDQIVVTAWGTFDSATENGNIFFRWNNETTGTQFGFGEGLNGGVWRITARVSVTGVATQEIFIESLDGTNPDSAPSGYVEHKSETDAISGAISIYLRGDNTDGTTDNAVSVRGFRVEIVPDI